MKLHDDILLRQLYKHSGEQNFIYNYPFCEILSTSLYFWYFYIQRTCNWQELLRAHKIKLQIQESNSVKSE